MKVSYCPACPEPRELRVLSGDRLARPLRRCDHCLGILADAGTALSVKAHYHAMHYVMVEGTGRHQCRRCGVLFGHDWQRCRQCLAEQGLGCVRCLLQMESVEMAGVALDVCKSCRLVWFDRGELGLLSRRHATELRLRLSPPAARSSLSVVGEAALYHFDVALPVADAARAGAEVTIGAVEQVASGSALEVVSSLGDGVASVTSGAIDVLVDLLGDIF